MIVERCSVCYWCRHGTACFAGGKYKKQIPREKWDLPNKCPDFRGK